MPFTAGDGCALVSAAVGIKQFFKQTSPDAVRCGANSHLARLQVDVILMTDISKYTLHKPIYFLRSFPANCLCNFFLRDSNSS